MGNCNGEVERIVLVVAIRIEREDQRLIAQLGKWEGSQIIPACQLPGGKEERGELIVHSVKGLLERLGLVQSDVEIINVERKVEWTESKKYGVRTKYLRTVCHAELKNRAIV